jgi:hypothetical protein
VYDKKINEAVREAETALAGALLVRITAMARDAYPDAVAIHTYRSDYEHGQVLWKVLGANGRVLWDREKGSGDEPFGGEGTWRMDRDVLAYEKLAGNRLKAMASGGWSMKLLPRTSATVNGPAVPPQGRVAIDFRNPGIRLDGVWNRPEPVEEAVPLPGEAFTVEGVRALMAHVRTLLDALAEDEAARSVAASAVSPEEWAEIWPRVASEGVVTVGCDCGHSGMGLLWHGDACGWKMGLSGKK